MPLLAEAMHALEDGTGTAEDIDTGAKVGLNHPMGPLELADFIGLDVCLNVMNVLYEGFGQPHFKAPRCSWTSWRPAISGRRRVAGSTPTRGPDARARRRKCRAAAG